MIYLKLFYEFFKTGLFAIGGGLATLPFLEEISQKTGWFTHAELANMIAVSESSPGPIGVNMATYVGYTTGCLQGGHFFGVLGAVVATLGLITPSVIIILIIAAFLRSFRDNKYVNAVFYGLRPASTGLVAAAGLGVVIMSLFNSDLYKSTGSLLDLFQWKAILLAAAILVLTRWVKPTKKLHPIIFILGAAVVGIVFHFGGV